ncbi:MAG TPA: protein kinase [Ktedonobacteraceae bacterium]|nr:protein kinase [Ktedonobacteraceae bacterium]
MQDVQAILPNGTIVQERYVVEDLLGRGGFGAVYLVRDLRVRGNLFALKEIIDSNKQERERFKFEGEVLKRLDNRSLPRVYRVFEDDNTARAYILMDYIEGPNLEVSRTQQPDKRFSVEQALDIMLPIFKAVSYLHKQNPPIIHRDIKPSNIIVPAAGDEAVLVDFGIAKEYSVDATTTAVRRCSPGYGAPEQYARGTNPRTDIYGLAATLYALLTGTVPIDAFYRMTQIGGKNHDPLEPVIQQVPSVSQSVSDAIQRAMAINSGDRFASVEEFWQALNEYHGGSPLLIPVVAPVATPRTEPPQAVALAAIGQEPVTVVTRPMKNNKRRGAFLMLFTALVLFALVGGLVLGSTHLFSPAPSNHPSSTATSATGKKAIATPRPSATAKPTATAKPIATKAPATQATTPPVPAGPVSTPPATTAPAPSGYPTLANSYSGTVNDQITSPATQGSLTLAQISQTNPNISGYATITGLQGSGNFSGQVTTGNHISFLVESFAGHPPLFFQGQISSNSISGTYCSYVNNACNYNAGGYGSWQVSSNQVSSSS